MSLTSYRTAPPRVTDLRSASDTPIIPLIITGPQTYCRSPEMTSRPTPAAVDKVHHNRPSRAPHIRGGRENLEGGPALKEQLFTVGLADLAATYSPVP